MKNVTLSALVIAGTQTITAAGLTALTLPQHRGPIGITICAEGGAVYADLLGVAASATSHIYVADGVIFQSGMVANITAASVFLASGATAHITYYVEHYGGV